MTISEYARKEGLSPSTVYRRIERGALHSVEEEGVQKVIIPDNEIPCNEDALKDAMIDELKRQVERVETQNTELLNALRDANETIKQIQSDATSAKERSDTIILQLTQQLDNQTKLIENVRQQQIPLWQKMKAKLGFGTIG